jgi:hypothetical protein
VPLWRLVGVTGLLALSAAPLRAEVRLTIQNGQVSLSAVDATAREILAEWARVGQTTIVNGERVPGGPLTLELANVTEEHALQVILRAASGYVAAPRTTASANLSRFDRILVMPTSTPTRGAPPPSPQFAVPTFQPPQQRFPPAQALPFELPTGQEEAVLPGEDAAPEGFEAPDQPIFTTFPPPQAAPPRSGMPFPYPVVTPFQGDPRTMPEGVAVPGMIVPAPAPQPGTPVIRIPDTLPDPEQR